MPTYHYRALTAVGELVHGSIDAPDPDELTRRIEYLGLVPIEATREPSAAGAPRFDAFASLSRPRPEDVTIFTGDLALLLRTGARIDEALELLAADTDIGRMRSTIAAVTTAILSGESFGEAVSRHPRVFPSIYVALARVGEASGALAPILEGLTAERQRGEALRRRLADTLRYPAFLLLAAGGVMLFFLTFVLPQFANVFRDFNAKLDPVLVAFLGMSEFLRANADALAVGVLAILVAGWLAARQPAIRARFVAVAGRLPFVRSVLDYQRATRFCRNLALLVSSGVTLSASLRILAELMDPSGTFTRWSQIDDRVRRGGRLSDALAEMRTLPPLAIRTLRLGEESGQMATLAGRVADFYEAKLQRSLDQVIGIAGPAAIIVISLVVGGLIVSVMTALLSVNQVVGQG
jgi:general secretion pathway protein F